MRAMPKGKLIGGWVDDGTTFTVLRAGGAPHTTCTVDLAAGTYYPVGDGASGDLLNAINDQLTAHPSGELASVVLTVSTTTGIVTWTDGNAGETGAITVTWGTSTRLRDFLRFTGTTTTIPDGGSKVADQCVLGSFYPGRVTIEDLPGESWVGATRIADSGAVEVDTYAIHSRLRLSLRYQGGPRESTAGEFAAMRDAWRRAKRGYPVRWYPDPATSTAAYAEWGTAWGYQAWVLRDGEEWDPASVVQGSHAWFRFDSSWTAYV